MYLFVKIKNKKYIRYFLDLVKWFDTIVGNNSCTFSVVNKPKCLSNNKNNIINKNAIVLNNKLYIACSIN